MIHQSISWRAVARDSEVARGFQPVLAVKHSWAAKIPHLSGILTLGGAQYSASFITEHFNAPTGSFVSQERMADCVTPYDWLITGRCLITRNTICKPPFNNIVYQITGSWLYVWFLIRTCFFLLHSGCNSNLFQSILR